MAISDSEAALEPADGPTHWRACDARAAAAIFAVALALRLGHWFEISANDPYFAIPAVDGAVYDAWARELASGRFLGDGVLFMGPLYPYAMAAFYATFGPSVPALKALQALIGAFSCVLVWGVAREMFDRRVAALAGVVAAFYGMSIFYGGTLMVVNLQIPLVLGVVWAWLRALRAPSSARWALCGLLLGLSVLARQTTLLLAPLALLGIALSLRASHTPRARIGFAAAFAAPIALCILPFSLHNYVAANDFVLLNSTGGANFYMGNQPTADGSWQRPSIGSRAAIDTPEAMQREFRLAAERATGRSLSASEVSSYWLGRGLDEIRRDPRRWLRLEVRKFVRFFSAYEVWNNRSFEISQRFSWVLRMPLATFGVVAPLGLLGLVVARRRFAALYPAYAVVAVYLASALIFFVLSRYRMPAAIVLIPFAAFALVSGFDRIRSRDYRSLAAPLVGLALFSALVHLPARDEDRMAMAWFNLANKFRDLERWDEAEAAYRESITENALDARAPNNLALMYELSGQTEAAIETWIAVGQLASKTGDAVRMERAARHLHALGVTHLKPDGSPGRAGEEPAASGPTPR